MKKDAPSLIATGGEEPMLPGRDGNAELESAPPPKDKLHVDTNPRVITEDDIAGYMDRKHQEIKAKTLNKKGGRFFKRSVNKKTKKEKKQEVAAPENPAKQLPINAIVPGHPQKKTNLSMRADRMVALMKKAEGEGVGESINLTFAIVNALIALILFSFSSTATTLIFWRLGPLNTSLPCFKRFDASADCQPEGENDCELVQFADCLFKAASFGLSCILLLPYFFESVLAADLFVGGQNKKRRADKGTHLLKKVIKRNAIQNMLYAIQRVGFFILVIFNLPFLIILAPFWSTAKILVISIPLIVPSLLLNLSLFPLSFVVLTYAEQPADTMIDLVSRAVPSFAKCS